MKKTIREQLRELAPQIIELGGDYKEWYSENHIIVGVWTFGSEYNLNPIEDIKDFLNDPSMENFIVEGDYYKCEGWSDILIEDYDIAKKVYELIKHIK